MSCLSDNVGRDDSSQELRKWGENEPRDDDIESSVNQRQFTLYYLESEQLLSSPYPQQNNMRPTLDYNLPV